MAASLTINHILTECLRLLRCLTQKGVQDVPESPFQCAVTEPRSQELGLWLRAEQEGGLWTPVCHS